MLTTLDAGVNRLQDLPHPPPAPDETQVTPLNTRWEILAARRAFPAGWRGRFARLVWAVVEPALATQQAFNSALVDHVNRNITPQREIPKAATSTITLVQQQVNQVIHFQKCLMVYLQLVTPYVDTKDYEFAGLAQRVVEDVQQELDQIDRTARGLAAGLSGVSDEMLRPLRISPRARSALHGADGRASVEHRSGAAADHGAQAGVRGCTRCAGCDRCVGCVGCVGCAGAATGTVGPPQPALPATGHPPQPTHGSTSGSRICTAGSQDDIRARQEIYLPLFEGAADVLDIGCGRGEFLDLLATHGIRARGLDLNHEMVEVCRARGLDVTEGDALGYLRTLPDESLGGILAAQVVEHLEPQYLLQVLDQAGRTLKPGATMVLETINVACWLAFFESYIRDITHVRPLHPDTLKYLVTASGFVDVNVQFGSSIDPANRLQPVSRVARTAGDDALRSLADTFDGNVERLNRLMFTHLDYAVIARRP